MTKSELVAKIAENKGASKKEAEECLESVFAVVSECLLKGEEVSVPGFGTFKVKVSSERDGINPLTKQKIHIAAKKNVAFKASKALKDELNK